MNFLRLAGWPIGIVPGSADFDVTWLDRDMRSEIGNQIVRRRKRRTRWSFRSIPVTADVAETIEGFVSGLGHTWSFDNATTYAFSSRGRAPISDAAIIQQNVDQRFGDGCVDLSGSIVWDLSRGIAPLLDRWTIRVWLDLGGTGTEWEAYVVRSDGAVWVDGVRNDTVSTPWLTVFNGFVTLTGTSVLVDDLVVLCFQAADEAIEAWHEWQVAGDRAFPAFPILEVSGAFEEGQSIAVIGTVAGSSIVTFADGDGWHENAQSIDFSLQAHRLEPRALLSSPDVFLSLDDEEGDPPQSQRAGSFATWSKVDDVNMGAVGQVEEAATFDGTGYLEAPDTTTLDISVTSNFSLAMWVRGDGAIVEVRGVAGKIASGVAGWAFYFTVGVGGLVPLFAMIDSTDTDRRQITGGLIPLEEWHHVAVVHTENGAWFDLYIDGERVTDATKTMNLSTSIANVLTARLGDAGLSDEGLSTTGWGFDDWGIGDLGSTPTLEGSALATPWLGEVDEFMAWTNEALTDVQVRAIFAAGAKKKRPPIPG